jgi:hypothetical protein
MGIELFVFVGVFVGRSDLICGRAWGAANRATREGRGVVRRVTGKRKIKAELTNRERGEIQKRLD